jgi:hypothetical protein
MLDWFLHKDAALLCLFAGLIVGAALGFVLGHDRGKIQAVDAMRRYADEREPEGPMVTWERMRERGRKA